MKFNQTPESVGRTIAPAGAHGSLQTFGKKIETE